ncbi:MAG: hypothetical protein WC044_03285 [Crocinitomicaceae bacterium]
MNHILLFLALIMGFESFGQESKPRLIQHRLYVGFSSSCEKIVMSDPIESPYPFTKLAYPAGSGTGYDYTQLKVNPANERNFSKELKIQYALTRKRLFATIGLTFSTWDLEFSGEYDWWKSYFKMPEPFQQQINHINCSFLYADQTSYLQIPMGVGFNLMKSERALQITPSVRINPEFQLNKKVLKNETVQDYYFHSEAIDYGTYHSDAYHYENSVLGENANELIKFNAKTPKNILLNPSLNLLFSYRIRQNFGVYFELGYKIASRYRIQMITGYEDYPSHSTDNINYQNNRSANGQLGVYYKF